MPAMPDIAESMGQPLDYEYASSRSELELKGGEHIDANTRVTNSMSLPIRDDSQSPMDVSLVRRSDVSVR